MKNFNSLNQHLRRMKGVTDQLAAIKAQIPEDERIVALSLSLPRTYNVLTTAFTAKGDELGLTQAHQALRCEDEQRGLHKSKGSDGRVDRGENAQQHYNMRKSIKFFGCGEENCVIRNCPKRKKGQHECRNKPEKSSYIFYTSYSGYVYNCWIIESDASPHMTADCDLLVNYHSFPQPEPVALGDGRSVDGYGYG